MVRLFLFGLTYKKIYGEERYAMVILFMKTIKLNLTYSMTNLFSILQYCKFDQRT